MHNLTGAWFHMKNKKKNMFNFAGKLDALNRDRINSQLLGFNVVENLIWTTKSEENLLLADLENWPPVIFASNLTHFFYMCCCCWWWWWWWWWWCCCCLFVYLFRIANSILVCIRFVMLWLKISFFKCILKCMHRC